MKQLITSILPLLMTAMTMAQQLDIHGESSSTDTVMQVTVNYSGIENVIGLSAFSHPVYNRGIGGYFFGGFSGVKGESVTYGVHGIHSANDAVGRGVFGESRYGKGIYGKSTNGFAGYFEGKTKVDGKLEVGSFDISYHEILNHSSADEASVELGQHAFCALSYLSIRNSTGTNRYAKVEEVAGIWYLKVRAESGDLEVSAGCYCID